MLTFACPTCRATLEPLQAVREYGRIRCPRCGTTFAPHAPDILQAESVCRPRATSRTGHQAHYDGEDARLPALAAYPASGLRRATGAAWLIIGVCGSVVSVAIVAIVVVIASSSRETVSVVGRWELFEATGSSTVTRPDPTVVEFNATARSCDSVHVREERGEGLYQLHLRTTRTRRGAAHG